jgi:hypothetical protein
MTLPTHVEVPELLTLPDVAKKTKISLRVLQDGCRMNPPRWDHIHIGRNRFMTAEQVARLVEGHAKCSGATAEQAADAATAARLARKSERRGKTPRQRSAA